jgi:Fe-coproporphyrin III synthase
MRGTVGSGPTGENRVIQFHPTRRCNLRCLHCYSESGPERREELEPGVLRDALEDAAAEGYGVASFSGGEPLLYEPLGDVLDHAHTCGLTTTVTSNGMLLTERRLARLADRVDLLAISLDGVPASHNRMRAHRRAFESMAKRLTGVRRAGIPFGFIFTLTQYNVNELDWVARFAQDEGARLLQIHPLESVGRATTRLVGAEPDETESTYAQLEAMRLREQARGDLLIQVDIGDSRRLAASPERVFAGEAPSSSHGLGHLVSPLVVETDGTVIPLQYGFARRYSLGNLHEAPLCHLAASWQGCGLRDFRALCESVFSELTDAASPRFANWYEAVSRRADQEELARVGA